MDGSPSSVISLGLGSWGSTGLVLTLGLGISDSPTTPAALSILRPAGMTARFTSNGPGAAVVTPSGMKAKIEEL